MQHSVNKQYTHFDRVTCDQRLGSPPEGDVPLIVSCSDTVGVPYPQIYESGDVKSNVKDSKRVQVTLSCERILFNSIRWTDECLSVSPCHLQTLSVVQQTGSEFFQRVPFILEQTCTGVT